MTIPKQDKDLFITCDCGSPECTLWFRYFSAFREDPPEVYLSYFLPRGRWYQRLWIAALYLFNKFPHYSHFGETIFDYERARSVRDFMDEYMEAWIEHDWSMNDA